jgi:two-component system phosphate regulon sensor histidine kinase PhoR
VLVAVTFLVYFTFRTSLQLETLRQQSVVEATLGLANEKADRLDKRIVEEDNVVVAVTDPSNLDALEDRWLPTASRETPSVRAILVLDEARNVLGFVSRAGGPLSTDEGFRRLLTQRFWTDLQFQGAPPDGLRHLHRVFGEVSYLISYWQVVSQGRRYFVVAWHDVPRIVRELLPALYTEPSQNSPLRFNVVDEEGRIIFGPPLRSGEFSVGVRFPTTLYNWRLQISPTASEELATRIQNRRILELSMLMLASVIVVIGVVTVVVAAENDRRTSALKSEFVANVSHELKTPLALIRMFAEMLRSGRVTTEEKRQEYLAVIDKESERLSALIENVLDFARLERGRQAFDLQLGDAGAAVLTATDAFRNRTEREGIELVVDIQPNLPTTALDEKAIQLAVINLLDNALKYAPESKEIRVEVSQEQQAVTIRVQDQGPGVAHADRERIFERFVRVPPRPKTSESPTPPVRGSGIGLSLVRNIAENHGGRAWVEDGPKGGSSFVLRLPLRSPSARPPTS